MLEKLSRNSRLSSKVPPMSLKTFIKRMLRKMKSYWIQSVSRQRN